MDVTPATINDLDRVGRPMYLMCAFHPTQLDPFSNYFLPQISHCPLVWKVPAWLHTLLQSGQLFANVPYILHRPQTRRKH